MRVTLRLCLLIGITLFVVACGTVAEPRPTFEPTSTSHPRLSLDETDEETIAEVDSEDVESAGTVGEAATEEVHANDHEHAAAPTETPAPVVEPTLEPTEEAVATEAHTDDHEHAEATAEAVATEESADDHEHAAATEEAAAQPEGITVVVIDGKEYVGEAEYGEDVFHNRQNPDPGPGALGKTRCVECHNPDEPVTGIGPYLYGIAAREGAHAEHDHGTGDELVAYLYESITDPNAQIAPAQVNSAGVLQEWQPNIMPQNWDDVLSDQQIADVIAYLMTLDEASE